MKFGLSEYSGNKVAVMRQASLMLALVCCSGSASAVQEQSQAGMSALGTTGHLLIPAAKVLQKGNMAMSLGNYFNSQLGNFREHENYSMGFGMGGGIEFFGRFAEYQIPLRSGYVNGPRDLSANVKWQLPLQRWPWMPAVAIGMTDIQGGTSFFHSKYAVMSDSYWWLDWSLGYAQSDNVHHRNNKPLDGVFGGVQFNLSDTGAALLAESDGTQQHVGIRYHSPELNWLGHSQLIGSVHRSFGAADDGNRPGDKTSYNLTFKLPLMTGMAQRRQNADQTTELPPLEQREGYHNLDEQMQKIVFALEQSGFDGIKVGTTSEHVLVVYYQNYRYLYNEVDAMGVVLGLATELAPSSMDQVQVVAFKSKQQLISAQVNINDFSQFLRGKTSKVENISFALSDQNELAEVDWYYGQEFSYWPRVELSPVTNYAVGTEYGAFDYSLGLGVRAIAGLWSGADLYADWVGRVSDSANMSPGGVYERSRLENGLKNAALQQSLWVTDFLFVSAGGGRYDYDSWGAEGEVIAFMPWHGDTVHIRGRYRQYDADHGDYTQEGSTIAYRKKFQQTDTWLELGYNQYTDSSRGASIKLTQWFDDVSVQLFGMKGGNNTFAGIQFGLPLTARQGMEAGKLQISGSPRFRANLRTRVAEDSNDSNFILPNAVKAVSMQYKPEIQHLNSGRLSADYFRAQLPRMRESFMVHARNLVP